MGLISSKCEIYFIKAMAILAHWIFLDEADERGRDTMALPNEQIRFYIYQGVGSKSGAAMVFEAF